jgi:hypothetical protein
MPALGMNTLNTAALVAIAVALMNQPEVPSSAMPAQTTRVDNKAPSARRGPAARANRDRMARVSCGFMRLSSSWQWS